MNTLPQQLRSARLAAGYTQEALAAATGIRQGRISEFERGARPVNVAALLTLTRALGVIVVPEGHGWRLVPRADVEAILKKYQEKD